jgi:hypothetical protein
MRGERKMFSDFKGPADRNAEVYTTKEQENDENYTITASQTAMYISCCKDY